MKLLVVAVLLLACRQSPKALVSECMCPCTCPTPDAAIDAEADAPSLSADSGDPPDATEPDAPPPPIDLTTPWTRTILTPGASTGLYRGADGVAEDAEHCWVTAWEEGGIVTRWCPTTGTEFVAQGLTGVEDARAAYLDGDGVLDVVSASDSGARVYVTFRGSPNVTVDLTESHGHGHAMQVAIGDVDGDTRPDIVFGTRVGSPAVVAWLQNPGPATARNAAAWTYHQISQAGWVMSLVLRDVNVDGRLDVIVSDRAKIGTADWSLYGARWMEQMADGTWTAHAISAPAGSCTPYTSPTCTKTPGDEMFLTVSGNDVYDCTSAATQADSRISIHHTTDWLSWTHVTLPPVANVGHCQGVLVADVDQDGDDDLVVTTWKGNAYPVPAPDAAKSGVYWLRNNGGGVYSRGEISGTDGGKMDNAEPFGRCVITSEQLDPQGGYGVLTYCPPGVSP